MNMKNSTLIISAALLAVAIIMSWFCGMGTGILMTLVYGALIAIYVLLINKNPRWWLVILALIVSISLIRCSFFKLMCGAGMKDAEEIIMEIQSEKDDDTSETTDSCGEKATSDSISEDDENSDVIKETEESPEDETQEFEDEQETVGVEKVEVDKNPTSTTQASKTAATTQASKPAATTQASKTAATTQASKTAATTQASKTAATTQASKPAATTQASKLETSTQASKPAATTQASKPAATTQANNPMTYPQTTVPYNTGFYGDPTGGSCGSNYGYGHTTDPTAAGYANNNYYSSSIKIQGETDVQSGESYTYTIKGVTSIIKSRLEVPDNVTIGDIKGNKVELYFEEGWSGPYEIGYQSATLDIYVWPEE